MLFYFCCMNSIKSYKLHRKVPNVMITLLQRYTEGNAQIRFYAEFGVRTRDN